MAKLPVIFLFVTEIYQHSAHCEHGRRYCSVLLLQHKSTNIITAHTASVQQDETSSAPQSTATYQITRQHLVASGDEDLLHLMER